MTRRLVVTLADQVLSSTSNLLIVLAVARISNVSEFGAFSLAFVAYQLMLGVTRSGAGDVLLIRSTESESSRETDPRKALSFVVALTCPIAAVLLIIGLLVEGDVGPPLAMIAIFLIPTLLQDCYRYIFFSSPRPKFSLVIDATWLVAQTGGFALAGLGVLPETAESLILIWGLGAGLACLVAAFFSRVTPGLNGLVWLRTGGRQVVGLMADFMLLAGTSYAAIALLSVVANLETVAALRGALFLFGPYLAFLTSVRVIALPALTRRLSGESWTYGRIVAALSSGLSVLLLVYAWVIWLLPQSLGEDLLGPSWSSVNAILIPVTLAMLAIAASYPAMESLRAMGNTRRLLVTRAAAAGLSATAIIAGAAVAGAPGGAMGMCIANIAMAILWFGSMHAALAKHPGFKPTTDPPTTAEAEVDQELAMLDGAHLP